MKKALVTGITGQDGSYLARLLLDKGYQDVQFSASYRCAAGCTAGVMVRPENGADGTKGVYTMISGDERSTATVTVDAQGRVLWSARFDEASRMPLREE